MKIEGHTASLNIIDRHVLDLPNSCKQETVDQLPLGRAFDRVISEINECNNAGFQALVPEVMWAFGMQNLLLRWKQHRLQQMAGIVINHEVSQYLQGEF